MLPLEERRVLHLVDDLLVDLLGLVALGELALHQVLVDLHREAREHRPLGHREAERALQLLVAVVLEDVLHLGLGVVAGLLRLHAHAVERHGRNLPGRAARLHLADAGGGSPRLELEAEVRGRDVLACVELLGLAGAREEEDVTHAVTKARFALRHEDTHLAGVVLAEIDRRVVLEPETSAAVAEIQHRAAALGPDRGDVGHALPLLEAPPAPAVLHADLGDAVAVRERHGGVQGHAGRTGRALAAGAALRARAATPGRERHPHDHDLRERSHCATSMRATVTVCLSWKRRYGMT